MVVAGDGEQHLFQKQTVRGIAGFQRGAVFAAFQQRGIGAKAQTALGFLRAVATRAVFFQHRQNVIGKEGIIGRIIFCIGRGSFFIRCAENFFHERWRVLCQVITAVRERAAEMPRCAQHGGGGEEADVIGKMFSQPEKNGGDDNAKCGGDAKPLMPEQQFRIVTTAERQQPAAQCGDDGERRGDGEDESGAGIGLVKTGKPRGNFQQRQHDDHADGKVDEQGMQPPDKEENFRRMVHEIKWCPGTDSNRGPID